MPEKAALQKSSSKKPPSKRRRKLRRVLVERVKKTKLRRFRRDRFADLMRRKKVSQADLAALLGVSHKQVNRWSTGRSEPENERLIMLADLFGVSTDFLLGRADKPERMVSGMTVLTAEQEAVLTAFESGDLRRLMELFGKRLDDAGKGGGQ